MRLNISQMMTKYSLVAPDRTSNGGKVLPHITDKTSKWAVNFKVISDYKHINFDQVEED